MEEGTAKPSGAEENGVGGGASAAALAASESLVSELRGSVETRERELEGLRTDRINLKTELDILKGRVSALLSFLLSAY